MRFSEALVLSDEFAKKTERPKKKSDTFRLSDETRGYLTEMAKTLGKSKTFILETSVKWAFQEWKAERAKKKLAK